jgi:hypothetical protein
MIGDDCTQLSHISLQIRLKNTHLVCLSQTPVYVRYAARPKKKLRYKHIAQNKDYTVCGAKSEHVIKRNKQLAAFRLMTVTCGSRNKKTTDE